MNVCIIFIKWPEVGKVKTRLATGSSNGFALAFYKLCCEHLVAKLSSRKEWRCTIAYSPPEQERAISKWLNTISQDLTFVPQARGPDLGARMGHSIRESLAAGAGKVVLVGSDIPDLRPEVVAAAFEALESKQAVDGGFYLIGGRLMPETLLQGIEWSSETVLTATLRNCKKEGVTTDSSTLPMLLDIDTIKDIHAWLADGQANPLKAPVQRLLSGSAQI